MSGFIMSGRFCIFSNLYFSFLICLSACSFSTSEGTKKIKMTLASNVDVFGMQGCIFQKNTYYSRTASNGGVEIYQYDNNNGEYRSIKIFLYVGSFVCEDDGVYFSAISADTSLDLYRYDGKILTVIRENMPCSVLSKLDSRRFVCYTDIGYGGEYSVGVVDLIENSYVETLSTFKYGLSEGFFVLLGDYVIGSFTEEKDKKHYLKSIVLKTGKVVGSLFLDCERFSVIAVNEKKLIYKCGSVVKTVNASLQ